MSAILPFLLPASRRLPSPSPPLPSIVLDAFPLTVN